MPSFRTTRRMQHAADEMPDIVADVERYPESVPLRYKLNVKRRAEGARARKLVADMTVAYGPMRQNFTSQVTLDRPAVRDPRRISRLFFSQPRNRWRFRAWRREEPEVDFFISYLISIEGARPPDGRRVR